MGKASKAKKVSATGTSSKKVKKSIVDAIKKIADDIPECKDCAEKVVKAINERIEIDSMSCYPIGVRVRELMIPPSTPKPPARSMRAGFPILYVTSEYDFTKDVTVTTENHYRFLRYRLGEIVKVGYGKIIKIIEWFTDSQTQTERSPTESDINIWRQDNWSKVYPGSRIIVLGPGSQ